MNTTDEGNQIEELGEDIVEILEVEVGPLGWIGVLDILKLQLIREAACKALPSLGSEVCTNPLEFSMRVLEADLGHLWHHSLS